MPLTTIIVSRKLLSVVLLAALPLSLPAKDSGKAAHPVRKIDTTPNLDDNDVWSLTLEANDYAGTDYLSPVLDFSAAGGWDVQLAAYNIPAYGGGAQNYEWDSYINVSKTFVLNQQWQLIAGAQNGTTAFAAPRQWHTVDYAMMSFQPVPLISVRAGPFWADKALTTTTDVVGYSAGFNLNFSAQFFVQADYFSGHNNLSGAVINVWYRMFYVGVGVPETDSGNEFYGISGVKLNLSRLLTP